MRLYDAAGNRLYLTAGERAQFLDAASKAPPPVRTFCETLAYTGCRISEALELVPKRIQLDERQVVFRSLKKRRSDVYRAVPVPFDYLDRLNMVHGIREAQKHSKRSEELLWEWTRQHATTKVIKSVMIEAGIPGGPHRTAKGLRHAFGVNAITRNVPLNMVQKWLGHADIKTTAIYANAIGAEEQEIAARMWD